MRTSASAPPAAPLAANTLRPHRLDAGQDRVTGFNPGESAVTMPPTAALAAYLGHPIVWMHGRTG